MEWERGVHRLDITASGRVALGKRRNFMRPDEIRGAQKAQPFIPFTMHLADGREFLVSHRDFLLVNKTGRVAIVEDLEGNIEIIDPLLVTSVSIPAGSPPTPA
jgi:hypothetical protein